MRVASRWGLEDTDLTPVFLNVYWQRGLAYNEQGRALRRLGGEGLSWTGKLLKDTLGVYHVGVEAHGVEYAFGNSRAPGSRQLGGEASGVFAHPPRRPGPRYVFKQAVGLGNTELSAWEVEEHGADLGSCYFPQDSYERVGHNCADFARWLSARLGTDELPMWCYRAAAFARLLGLGAGHGTVNMETGFERFEI